MTIPAVQLFHFLRGALRGAYGDEDLRNHAFLLVGMSQLGQELLGYLCIDGINVRFQDPAIKNYYRSFSICGEVDIYEGGEVDVIVDLNNGFLSLNEKTFPIGKIGSDPYTQGIHEFYL